ncbi:DUF4345 domain-containing protein [Paracoccus aurantiacus]|uniref:DUF4345 domain-containing protein n=1 Tax=Paracoccus aurantiacus TaxID=2599412 RepID=UPI00164A6B58|nr:DUF4345 domain-containing protein [Paracoccus aurantiacus]
MARTLSTLSAIFGAVCCLIALAHIAIGPASIPGSVPVNATMDSEDRFYATLFLGFGAAMIWASRDLSERRRLFQALLLVFFLGGIARLISVAAVGWPNALFVFLTVVELVLPPVFIWMHRRAYPG